jgi:hypothetical protein
MYAYRRDVNSKVYTIQPGFTYSARGMLSCEGRQGNLNSQQ